MRNDTFTRRAFMTYDAVMRGCDSDEARTVVERWAEHHPDVDLDDDVTWPAWQEWQQDHGGWWADAGTPVAR